VSCSKNWFRAHNSRQAEVSQLNVVLLIQENIPWFQISVQYLSIFAVMAHLQSLQNLRKYHPYHVFR
jgi:hypothetical protein